MRAAKLKPLIHTPRMVRDPFWQQESQAYHLPTSPAEPASRRRCVLMRDLLVMPAGVSALCLDGFAYESWLWLEMGAHQKSDRTQLSRGVREEQEVEMWVRRRPDAGATATFFG